MPEHFRHENVNTYFWQYALIISMLRFHLLLLIPFSVFCQSIEIQDSSGKTILIIENDQLMEANGKKPFVTIKGNTVFDGASEDKNDILLLVTVENIFSKKKTGYALNARQDEALFTIRNAGFFYKESKTFEHSRMMGYFEKEDDGSLVLRKYDSDTVLCRIPPFNLSTGKLVAIFYYFMRKFDLEKPVERQIQETQMTAPAKDVSATSGTISRLWNTGLDEFVWDGQVLKRKWNSFIWPKLEFPEKKT